MSGIFSCSECCDLDIPKRRAGTPKGSVFHAEVEIIGDVGFIQAGFVKGECMSQFSLVAFVGGWWLRPDSRRELRSSKGAVWDRKICSERQSHGCGHRDIAK